MSFKDQLISDCYFEEFKASCKKNEHRLTLGYFGIDLIIDKEGDIHCIEVNGQNAGTKGFKEAYGHDFASENVLKYLASFGLPVTVYAYSDKGEDKNWDKFGITVKDLIQVRLHYSKRAMNVLFGTGELTDKEYYDLRGNLNKTEIEALNGLYRLLWLEEGNLRQDNENRNVYNFSEIEGVIWNATNYTDMFDENRFLVVNSRAIEIMNQYKLVPYFLAADYISPLYFIEKFDAENFAHHSRLIKDVKKMRPKKIVFKPDYGRCGEGVVVLDSDKLINSSGKVHKDLESLIQEPEKHLDDQALIKNINILRKTEGVIVQPFIESKPSYSPKTKKYHRGSIRHIVAVKSERGEIDVNHIGAYARLAKEPIGDSIDSSVANLHRGAHAVPVPAKDFNRLKKWIDPFFKKFYTRLIRVGNGHKDPLKGSLSFFNYLFPDRPKLLKEVWRWW